MDQPWSSSQFLVLYSVGFYATLILTFVVQGLLTRVGSRRGVDDLRPDVWQGAFVAGGYRRVVDTAIAALVMRDQVLVSRRGVLTLVGGALPGGPIERAVCAALCGTTSYRTVLRRLRYDPAMLAVEEQARSRGLMLGGVRAVWWYLVMLPFLAIAGVGLIIGNADPDLVRLVFLSGAIVAVLSFRLRIRHRCSPAGRAVVRQLTQVYESRPAPEGAAVAGVAVMGFHAVHSLDLRWALQKSAGVRRTGDGD
jgi:uncharacterized protein (TIGR04222 family)